MRDSTATETTPLIQCSRGVEGLIEGFHTAAWEIDFTSEGVDVAITGQRHVHVPAGLTDQGLGGLLIEGYLIHQGRNPEQTQTVQAAIGYLTLSCLGRDLRSKDPQKILPARLAGIIEPHYRR